MHKYNTVMHIYADATSFLFFHISFTNIRNFPNRKILD